MNPLSILGGPWSSLLGALLLGIALGGTGAWKVQNWRAAGVQLKLQQAADAQAERNRELQRAAEKRYTVQAEIRDRFIVETVTEIRHDTENLAACVLTPAAGDRLRRAAACARGDSAAACGVGEPVRDAQ